MIENSLLDAVFNRTLSCNFLSGRVLEQAAALLKSRNHHL